MMMTTEQKDMVKKQILEVLTNRLQSTFQISKKVARSWGLTNSLLIELQEKGLIKKQQVSNILSWKLVK